MLTTDRFGFFGAAVAADVSEPDFLVFTTVVDFLSTALLSLLFGTSSLAVVEEAVVPVPDSDEPVPEPADPCDESDEPDEVDEDDSDALESVGPAHATPGAATTATPTPSAIASPPTRPMQFA